MYISVVRVFKSGEMRYDSEKRKTRFFRKKLYVISLITIESLIAHVFLTRRYHRFDSRVRMAEPMCS